MPPWIMLCDRYCWSEQTNNFASFHKRRLVVNDKVCGLQWSHTHCGGQTLLLCIPAAVRQSGLNKIGPGNHPQAELHVGQSNYRRLWSQCKHHVALAAYRGSHHQETGAPPGPKISRELLARHTKYASISLVFCTCTIPTRNLSCMQSNITVN